MMSSTSPLLKRIKVYLKERPRKFYFGLLLALPLAVLMLPFILFVATCILIILSIAGVFALVFGTIYWCFSDSKEKWFEAVKEVFKAI